MPEPEATVRLTAWQVSCKTGKVREMLRERGLDPEKPFGARDSATAISSTVAT
jgi:hypothetical protein